MQCVWRPPEHLEYRGESLSVYLEICVIPLHGQKPHWTISELARHWNVSKSGVLRLVKAFRRKQFLQSRDDSHEYELGTGIWELTGTGFGKRERLVEKASPHLHDLNRITGLLVSLRIFENEQMVIVDRVEGNDPVKVIVPVGTHRPLNHGAPGILLLACRYSGDGNQLREFIAGGKITKLTDRALVDPRKPGAVANISKHFFLTSPAYARYANSYKKFVNAFNIKNTLPPIVASSRAGMAEARQKFWNLEPRRMAVRLSEFLSRAGAVIKLLTKARNAHEFGSYQEFGIRR